MNDEQFARFIAAVPLARAGDYRIAGAREGYLELAAPVRPGSLQVENVVHGGVIATLADSAAVCLLLPGIGADEVMTSIEFKLNFLRPATAGGGDLVAKARLVKRGRQVALCQVDVNQGERHVAAGLFTYLISGR